MAQWLVGNLETKNAVQIMTWIKSDLIIQITEVYRFGEWSCHSKKRPEIDLENEQGFDITASEYSWEMSFMNDGLGYEFIFPDEMDESERELIQDAWNEKFYEGLEELGWEEQPITHKIYGPLFLKEEVEDN